MCSGGQPSAVVDNNPKMKVFSKPNATLSNFYKDPQMFSKSPNLNKNETARVFSHWQSTRAIISQTFKTTQEDRCPKKVPEFCSCKILKVANPDTSKKSPKGCNFAHQMVVTLSETVILSQHLVKL